jgi:hypothetical protein
MRESSTPEGAAMDFLKQDQFYKELRERFTGRAVVFPHPTRLIFYSEGVRYVAETLNAYWLIDVIAAAQPFACRDAWLRQFQLWEVFGTNGKARVRCLRDADDTAFEVHEPAREFALDYVRLHVIDKTLHLPSEH